MGGVTILLLVLLFRESRGSVLLSRKARALNKWYEKLEGEGYFGVWEVEGGREESVGNVLPGDGSDEEKGSISKPGQTTAGLRRIRWLVKEDEERASLGKMIAISISRPFHLLFTEPVVFFFSLWVSFAWGILYLTFGSIPFVFQLVYGWSLEQAGYAFVSLVIGAILATAIGIWQEQILYHPKWADPPLQAAGSPSNSDISDDTSDKTPPAPTNSASSRSDRVWAFLRRHFPASAPESRLYFTCITSTLLPIGLFIFGFASRPDRHWIGPAIGLVLATIGIFSIYLAVFNYFADTYHKYASSALAAQSFCRNVLGGAFPLVTGPLFRNLGAARAGGLLGAIAVALTVVPWVLVFFGDRIRARSPFASVSLFSGELSEDGYTNDMCSNSAKRDLGVRKGWYRRHQSSTIPCIQRKSDIGLSSTWKIDRAMHVVEYRCYYMLPHLEAGICSQSTSSSLVPFSPLRFTPDSFLLASPNTSSSLKSSSSGSSSNSGSGSGSASPSTPFPPEACSAAANAAGFSVPSSFTSSTRCSVKSTTR
jgi:hypothetical protein